jgi:hypothetical protein
MEKEKIRLEDVTLIGLYSGFPGKDFDPVEGKKAFKRAFDVSTSYMDFGAVKMLTHPRVGKFEGYEVLEVLPDIQTRTEGSKWIIENIYKYIDTTHYLYIHADGFILNPDAWEEQFLAYDYVAAPSPWEEYSCVCGGFTLRSKALMEYVATNKHDWFHPEDYVIAIERRDELEKKGFTFAPRDVAERFCHEKNARYFQGWDGEFGFHDITKTDIQKWKHPDFFKYTWDEKIMQIKSPSVRQGAYPPVREAHVYD